MKPVDRLEALIRERVADALKLSKMQSGLTYRLHVDRDETVREALLANRARLNELADEILELTAAYHLATVKMAAN